MANIFANRADNTVAERKCLVDVFRSFQSQKACQCRFTNVAARAKIEQPTSAKHIAK